MLNGVVSIFCLMVLVLTIGLVSAKEVFTKFLFMNMMSNIAILIIVAMSSYKYNSSFLDIALIYSILSFIAPQGLLKKVLSLRH